MSIAVVVLGDLDRSPRMCNHALSAARSGHFAEVRLIGYSTAGLDSLPSALRENSFIRPVFLSTWLIDKLRKLPRFLYLLYALLRIIIQSLQLVCALWRPCQPYDYILIQNPPCVPLLFICCLVRVLTCFRTQLIIDWHNYGFTIMRVNNVNAKLVGMARWYELAFGRFGDHHLTVSEAMKKDLLTLIPRLRDERVHVLYDRATSKFKPGLSMQDKFDVLERVGLEGIIEQLTELAIPQYKKDRPVLMLSSTSYTPDEDFMVLVNALNIYDNDPSNKQKIQVIVTGRGPQRDLYD